MPRHEVIIQKGFEIQSTELTQEQWVSVIGTNPSFFKEVEYCPLSYTSSPVPMCPDRPVENLTWEDTQNFISHLNTLNDGYLYRLPTEAEWEYVAQGGTQTEYFWGDSYRQASEYAWVAINSWGQTHPAGSLKPNAFGLYDTAGNVSEWVQDWFGYYPDEDPSIDPIGPGSGTMHIYRGGSWHSTPIYFRPTVRNASKMLNHSRAIGFRMVRLPR